MSSASDRAPRVGAGVRGIVFDLDGTLVDSYGAIAESLNHARAAFGRPELEEQAVRRLVGHGLEALIEEQLGPAHVAEGVRLFRERYAEICVGRTTPLPGVGLALPRLGQRGYRMAVASNKPARFAEPILDGLGLLEHFSFVAGPDRVGSTKPDPAMLRACLERLALSADEALYVGDMVLDVETAARAGMRLVLLATGSCTESELRSTGQPVLGSFAELLAALDA